MTLNESQYQRLKIAYHVYTIVKVDKSLSDTAAARDGIYNMIEVWRELNQPPPDMSCGHCKYQFILNVYERTNYFNFK